MPKGIPPIEHRLAEAHVAITNLRASDELQAALAAYGYTPSACGKASSYAMRQKHTTSTRSRPMAGCAPPSMR